MELGAGLVGGEAGVASAGCGEDGGAAAHPDGMDVELDDMLANGVVNSALGAPSQGCRRCCDTAGRAGCDCREAGGDLERILKRSSWLGIRSWQASIF